MRSAHRRPGTALLIIGGLLSVPACRHQTAANAGLVVPFTLDRHRVIVPTRINGSHPLRLILDTGMRFDGVYLFRRELANEIDMSGATEVRVPGAGSGEASTARMIESGSLTFGEVTVNGQRVMISQSPLTQSFRTDGVLGWNLFGHYAVEIDYDREVILLRDTSAVAPDSSWTVVPVTMRDNLPFLEATVEVTPGERVAVTLYVDLASGDALEMLVHDRQRYTMPDNLEPSYLGTGLSGDIHGWKGSTRNLWIGRYRLSRIPTSFAPAAVRSKQQGADGVLASGCMSRFNTIYDYVHSRLYLRPSKYYDVPIE
jgi:hypothetical protein